MIDDSGRDCLACGDGLNQHENYLIETMIRWLKTVTCIEWVIGYSDTGIVSDLNENDQYGTLTIESLMPSDINTSNVVQKSDNDACVEILNSVSVTVDLNVFNYSYIDDDEGTINRTSADILLRVNDLRQVERTGRYLINNGVHVKETSKIVNIFERDNSFYRRRSSMSMELCVDRKTSYVDDVIEGYCLDLDCPNKNDKASEVNCAN